MSVTTSACIVGPMACASFTVLHSGAELTGTGKVARVGQGRDGGKAGGVILDREGQNEA